ncbi:MAG TPA: alkaline phosphatase family protein [Vicinamibacteria bacterium]|nr:alkaline phosphatase family protein [Vicinamibacteria bacterium]
MTKRISMLAALLAAGVSAARAQAPESGESVPDEPAASPLPAPGPAATADPAPRAPRSARAAWLEMFARAYYPGRSGQVMVVPREGDMLTSPRADLRFMHGTPWDYDSRIPLVFWGQRYVRPGRKMERAVHQDVVPTLGRALGLAVPGATGRVLASALKPGAPAPRLVVLVVLDGFRADYLDRHASVLPNLTRLRREGASFERAQANVLPTITAVGHSTIATGTDPRFHGIVANNSYDWTTGKVGEPFPRLSPDNLMVPALADLWSWETDGRAVVVAQSSSASATALAGHGACSFNGRRVAYASYASSSGRWETNPRCYRLPDHLATVDVRTLWEGNDGTWQGHPAATSEEVRRTAPFARFEGDALVSTIEKEEIGTDEVPDLVLANIKVVDTVGHAYGPDSEEIRMTVAEVDRQVGRIVEAASARAGRDGVLVAVTSDHGMPAEPPKGRARRYHTEVITLVHDRFDPEKKLVSYFGAESGQLFIDRARARALGVRMEQIRDLLQGEPYIAAAFTEDEVRRVRLP